MNPPSGGCAPETVYSVRALFQSIVKAWYFILYLSGWFNLPLENLSRMMGNYHVRFLGDKGGVTRLSYPISNLKRHNYE